jgi:hypothetical protein
VFNISLLAVLVEAVLVDSGAAETFCAQADKIKDIATTRTKRIFFIFPCLIRLL